MTPPVSADVSVGLTATPIKAAIKKTAPPKPKSHPPTSEMVNAALSALKDKKGSSLQAIKKYIVTTYEVDLKKQSAFIRKYLKSAVEKETIVQAKGNGASGRFKLAAENEKIAKKSTAKKLSSQKAAKKSTVAKAAKPKTERNAKKSTATGEKKSATKKQMVAQKTANKISSPKSRSKTTKSANAPAAKAPKPKKVTTPKATSLKK